MKYTGPTYRPPYEANNLLPQVTAGWQKMLKWINSLEKRDDEFLNNVPERHSI